MEVEKSFNGRIPHTEFRVTMAGRDALDAYWRDLDAIRSMHDKSDSETDNDGDS